MLKNEHSRRLAVELKQLCRHPPPGVLAIGVDLEPDGRLRVIRMLVAGASSTDYQNGEYIIRADIPEAYPWTPPAIHFDTPSGRFITGAPVCVAGLTGHHSRYWSPAMTLEKLAVGAISVMNEELHGQGALVITDFSAADTNAVRTARRKMAVESVDFNRQNLRHEDMWRVPMEPDATPLANLCDAGRKRGVLTTPRQDGETSKNERASKKPKGNVV